MKDRLHERVAAALAILVIVAAMPALAASGVFTGSVLDGSGGPVAGVAVTATHRKLARSTTVFLPMV